MPKKGLASSADLKFEEAWDEHIQDVISVADLYELWLDNNNGLPDKHRYSLLCPECRNALLTFYSAPIPHLKTKAQAIHGAKCSLKQIPVKYKAIKSIYEDPADYELISDFMKRFHNYLLHKPTIKQDQHPFIINIPKTASKVPENKKNTEKYIRSQFPRKKIRNILDDRYLGSIKLFYGDFIVKWKPITSTFNEGKKEWMELSLTLPKYPKVFYTIRMSMPIYNHLSYTGQDGECARVYVTTEFTKRPYKNGVIYFNSGIKHSCFLDIYSQEHGCGINDSSAMK